ncbi:MAG: HNH endonuclease [Prevotellaceae bacterium]|jgi:hypothetical protein|nr:HNH endonuclease [Prevotellaceae bacterium]
MKNEKLNPELERRLRQISDCRWAKVPLPDSVSAKLKDYFVSEVSDVFSAFRKKDGSYGISRMTLRVHPGWHPYYAVNGKCVQLHKSVWFAFNSDKWEYDTELDHIDGDIYNCRLDNLKLLTGHAFSNDMREYIHIYKEQFGLMCSKLVWYNRNIHFTQT